MPRPRIWFLLGAALLAGCGKGGGGDNWGLDSLQIGRDARIADLDGDGRADLVTLSYKGSGHVQVFLQTAPGSFAAPVDLAAGSDPTRVYVADLEGAGAPGLLVTDSWTRTVQWCRQDPAVRGAFEPARTLVSGADADELAVADLDGDGRLDLALGDNVAASLAVLHQDPAHPGAFLPAVGLGLPGAPSNLVAGDLDGDGAADLFVWVATNAYAGDGQLGVLFQGAGGVLGPFQSLATLTASYPQRLALGAPGAGGRRDLLACLQSTTPGVDGRVAVLRQGPGRVFSAPVFTSVPVRLGDDAAFADLDGDGLTDVVVLTTDHTPASRLTVLRQNSGGTFTVAGTYPLPEASSTVAAGDLDGDGRPDLVVVTNRNVPMVLIQAHDGSGTFAQPGPIY